MPVRNANFYEFKNGNKNFKKYSRSRRFVTGDILNQYYLNILKIHLILYAFAKANKKKFKRLNPYSTNLKSDSAIHPALSRSSTAIICP